MTERRSKYNGLPLMLTIDGNPIPKGRPRVENGHARTPERTREYEALVRESVALAWKEGPIGAPIGIILHFARGNRIRCDLDNLVKAVLDALNGIVWEDDCQIVHLEAYKKYDKDNPHVSIVVGRPSL